LLDSFFRFQDDFSAWVDQRKLNKAPDWDTIDDDAALHFGIDRNDLANLNGVVRSVMASLKNIDKDFQDYANQRARYEQWPEPSVVEQFAARRRQAVQDGADRLRKNLSTAGWQAVRDYVNNVHRLRFRRFQPQ
jgi:hypothetical protein